MERFLDKNAPPRERAEDLCGRMTLREKVGQLNQRLFGFRAFEREGDDVHLSREFTDEVDRWGGLGALYGLHRADTWAGRDFDNGLTGPLAVRARNLIQRYVTEHSRFAIPVLITDECPHGPHMLDGYLLPVNLAAGCTFAPELLAKAAAMGGEQLRALGVDMALVSMLDVLRDPRWGRSEECYGEDPYLCARMAEAVVRAIQGAGVDVVAKHMCAQGETTGGVNASAARIGPRELRQIHLPPVEAAVRAGAAAVMAAYDEIDGLYCHANRWLLTDLLRGEYGFQGFVMSDGCAVDRLDELTGDPAASGALAVFSGVDMGLWDRGFASLEQAVERRLVSAAAIDEAAVRVLTAKFRRGLFDAPPVPENETWRGYTPEKYPAVRELARQSLVLLKNRNGLLPLSLEKPLRVGLIGPSADAVYDQLGDYTPPMRPGAVITLRGGLETLLAGTPAALSYIPGCSLFSHDLDEDAVRAFAGTQDVLIAAVGGSSSRFAGGEFDDNGALRAQAAVTMDCGENVDSAGLRLPGDQLRLLALLRQSGKPVVTVLIAGRPYEMADIDACSDAILCAFYPGPTGGEAVAEVLFGRAEPAGRLSVSLPDRVGQLPVCYNAKASYTPMRWYDMPAPKYTFGCGESYTAFSYALLAGPVAEARRVRFSVTNTGPRPGWAVPQLYVRRLQGVTAPRVRQLCGFAKRCLQPGEAADVTIPIPDEALRQWDAAMRPCVPPGTIRWMLCDGGETLLEGQFLLPEQNG